MKTRTQGRHLELSNGARVAVIGGGPAGSFFALHLLRRAAALNRRVELAVFERRLEAGPSGPGAPCWKGCNYCAGGISPQLSDLLSGLGLVLPEKMVQARIHTITIQGFWKNIEIEVPPGRSLVTVYRGARPEKSGDPDQSFDCFLLERARREGAAVVNATVSDVRRLKDGTLEVVYSQSEGTGRWLADFVVFAAGINELAGAPPRQGLMVHTLRSLLPGFTPPRARQALIFELQASPHLPHSLHGGLQYVEYGSKTLPLEMCSVVPKRNYITVTLVGASVDGLAHCSDARVVAEKFLELPHVTKLIPPGLRLSLGCCCRPNMVVGSAKNPFGDRVAAVGDLVTARLYKDGILSACRTAKSLADAALDRGIDRDSLEQGYGATLRKIRIDNRYAGLVFLLHRLFFSSSVLSRVLYQAVIAERKTRPARHRRLERILWNIASGDDDYREIFQAMLHPLTLWRVMAGGALVTLRNYLAELFFGLKWEGIGRFTTGVALERLEGKRALFANLIATAGIHVARPLEFERMYTIRINAPAEAVLDALGTFGEPDRGYLRPRWVRIRRVAGSPNTPGCVIQYEVGASCFTFHLVLEWLMGGHLAIYRVRDGFARGGILIFDIESVSQGISALSIYVAFNFPRGKRWAGRLFWTLFRWLFPAFVHDVLWNHSLCQLKDLVEGSSQSRAAKASPA